MRRRSPNSKPAVVTIVAAVILASQLIRPGPTQPRAEPQESKSTTAEFDDLFVGGLRNPIVREGADNVRTTAPNRFVADSTGAKLAGDSPSGLGSQMRTDNLPYK